MQLSPATVETPLPSDLGHMALHVMMPTASSTKMFIEKKKLLQNYCKAKEELIVRCFLKIFQSKFQIHSE